MSYDLKGKRILVTGGTGYIGKYLIDRLLNLDVFIRVLVRRDNDMVIKSDKLQYFFGDLMDEASLDRAVNGCQVVMHLAAVLGDKNEPLSVYRRINIDGTKALAEAAIRHKVELFLHTSSVWAYGLEPKSCIDETHQLKLSGTPYGDTKAESQKIIEDLRKEKGLPGIIVQPGDVIGPGDTKWTIGPLNLMKSGKFTLVDNGKGLFQPIYIADVVEGMLLAAQKGRIGEVYILCGSETVTFKEYFYLLAALAGVDKLPSVPYWLAISMAVTIEAASKIFMFKPPFNKTGIIGTSRENTYSITKAQKELGFVPRVTIKEAIREIRELGISK
jgi:nucleoside-diphosphate-sugar epimerase